MPRLHVCGSSMSIVTSFVSRCLAGMSSMVVRGVPVLVNCPLHSQSLKNAKQFHSKEIIRLYFVHMVGHY